jgi:hypothetical protein
MSTNKKSTSNKTTKKAAPTKATPKKQTPKSKNVAPKKSGAPTKNAQFKAKAKDGDGDGIVQDGTAHERRKPGRPKKQASPAVEAVAKPAIVVTPNVNVQATGIEVASSSTTTTASGIVPPIAPPKTAHASTPVKKKRGFFSRIFRRNKKSR